MTHDDEAPVTQPMWPTADEAVVLTPAPRPMPTPEPMPEARPAPLGLIEVLDRDGQVRQSFTVAHWPLRIGRALDNDLVLGDAHVAAEHLSIAPGEQGLALVVGNTRNGMQLGARKLTAGASHPLASVGDATEFTVGRTRLRLRLPQNTLAAEQPFAVVAPLRQRLLPILAAALVLLVGMLFNTYLDTDADGLGRAVGSMLLGTVAGGAIWCGAWALLSKTFTHLARFGWHLRVFLISSSAWLVVGALPAVLAFAFSWPWLTDFAFIGTPSRLRAPLPSAPRPWLRIRVAHIRGCCRQRFPRLPAHA